jgi:hypothetical protein
VKEDVLNLKDRVKAIIASGKTCFTEDDAPVLEQLSEDRIKSLEDRITEPEPEPAPVAEPEPVSATPMTEEEWMAAAPASIKQILDDHQAQQASERKDLLTQLEAAKSPFTKDELESKPNSELRKLAAMVVKPKDFGGNNAPRAAADVDEGVPPAPDFHETIRASRSAH